MAQITLEQASNFGGNGGKYFKINADESKQVRFLVNRLEDLNNWSFGVHELSSTSADGNKSFDTVDCPRAGGAEVECKYCEQGIKKSGVTIIPVFNIDENKIQYWKRSSSWVRNNLIPLLEELTTLPSIANQTFKIKRTGSTMNDTRYTVILVPNATDNRDSSSFGDVESPYDSGMIKKYGEVQNAAQQPQGQPIQQSTGYVPRRTTEMF